MASSAYRYYAGNGNYYTYENGKMLLRDKTGHLVKGASHGNVSKVMKRDAEKKGANKHNTHKSSSNSSSSSSGGGSDTSSTDTSTTDTTTDSSSSGGSYKTTIEEVEIDNYYEALRFAYKYIHMCLRDDGHEVQLKVIGGNKWKIGEWCKIDIPSFNESGTMFISKCNTELGANDENIATLTLVDFPPSLSSGTSNSPSSDGSSGSDTSSTDTSGTDSSSDSSGGDSSSSASTSSSSTSNSSSGKSSSGKTSSKSKSKSKTKTKVKSSIKGSTKLNTRISSRGTGIVNNSASLTSIRK